MPMMPSMPRGRRNTSSRFEAIMIGDKEAKQARRGGPANNVQARAINATQG